MRLIIAVLAMAGVLPAQTAAPQPAMLCDVRAKPAAYGSLTMRYELDAEAKVMRRLVIWSVPGGSPHPLRYLTLFFELDGSSPARIGPKVDTISAAHGVNVGRRGPPTAQAVIEVEGGAAASKPWNMYGEARAKGKGSVNGSAPFYRGDGFSNAMMDSLDRALATGSFALESKIVAPDGRVLNRGRFQSRDFEARDRDVARLGEAMEVLSAEPRKYCRRAGQFPSRQITI